MCSVAGNHHTRGGRKQARSILEARAKQTDCLHTEGGMAMHEALGSVGHESEARMVARKTQWYEQHGCDAIHLYSLNKASQQQPAQRSSDVPEPPSPPQPR
mmetsp:Transcript_35937/g.52740  ORF Transcript_35937/g.52740 Transcript_35937/m.52740 type:complete len:101 (-) Transcript_35937:110-412(-)